MALFSLDQIATLGNESRSSTSTTRSSTRSPPTSPTTPTRSTSRVPELHVDQTVFGESTVGGSLGYHHSLAHSKVADTLASVLEDLHSFRMGLQTFQKAVDSADTQNGDDLRARHEAVAALGRAADFHRTHSRNHYYHPGAHQGSGGSDA